MKKLSAPMKVSIYGLLIASIIIGGGYLYITSKQASLDELVDRCVAEDDGGTFGGILICNPMELSTSSRSNPLVGIQREIMLRQEAIWRDREWLELFFFIVLIVSVTPVVWYFLLGRIKELSNAITGK